MNVLLSTAAAALLIGQPDAARIQRRHHQSGMRAEADVVENSTALVAAQSTSGYGCKVETDPEKCAREALRCTKKCQHCKWGFCAPAIPCVPPQKIDGCNIDCTVSAGCTFKVRAKMVGSIDTTNFMKANVSFQHKDFDVTDGEKVIRDLLSGGTQKAILNGLISRMVGDVEGTVQEQLGKWKEDLKSMLIEKLGSDEVFGSYGFLHGFIGNSTELVEALVPWATLNTTTDDENLTGIMELPEARAFAEKRFSHTMTNLPWYYHILPGLAVGGLVALKFPRWGLAVAIVLAGLTLYYSETISDAVGPQLMGHTNITIKAKFPDDAKEAGAPDELAFHTWFEGTSMFVAFDPLSTSLIDQIITNVAMKGVDRPNDIPIKIVGAGIHLWAKGHHIEVQDGSYGDVEAELDLSCFPNCPGKCGGIIRC